MTDIERWKGLAADVVFEPSDFDILDLTLCRDPDLRLTAFALKKARESGLRFPVDAPEKLSMLLGSSPREERCGHSIGKEEIVKYMPREWFPINHEGELVSCVYLALARCAHDAPDTHMVESKASKDVYKL